MANDEVIMIQSRLGERTVRLDRVLHFPRGLIGFENARQFTLLQIQADAPLHVLQSMEEPTFGLLVADPFIFIPDFNLTIGDADQELLQAAGIADLLVLVTATIPPGQPEQTTLNLLGPIVINHQARIGLQAPQVEKDNVPSRVHIHMRELG